MNRILLGMLLTVMSAAVFAQSATSENMARRLDRLEQRLSSKVFLDMVEKTERLQSDLQQMRGEMETLMHKVEGMQKRQKDLYLDLDKRLLDLENGGAPSSSISQGGDNTQDLSNVDAAPPVQVKEEQPVQKPNKVVDATELAKKSPAVKSGSDEDAYNQAFGLLNNGLYDDAIAEFTAVLNKYPDSNYADNSQYWLGETYYVLRNFDAARGSFDAVIENYKESEKVPDAMLKLGFIDYEQGRWKASKKNLKSVIKAYPESNAARLADQRLKRIKSERH